MDGVEMILVPGLWLQGSVWEPVVAELRALGIDAVPVTLPGQGDGARSATLEEQLSAVLTLIDEARSPVLVGHSAACTLVWMAAARRPGRVVHVILIGGFPHAQGERYADFFPIEDAQMPFPGWAPFAGADSADMDDVSKAEFARATIPVPEGVATGVVTYPSERHTDIPVTVICPEFTPEQARSAIAAGQVPELAAAREVSFVDLDSGHWPMITCPAELARILHESSR